MAKTRNPKVTNCASSYGICHSFFLYSTIPLSLPQSKKTIWDKVERTTGNLTTIQIGTFDYTQLGFQFLDFQLKSFVDPKPVELGESAIYQKFCLNKLV